MAINKPVRPDSELPESWGGTQYPYSEYQIAEGFPETVPTVIDGGTLNYEKNAVFERLKYLTAIADAINNIPIGKMLVVDSNNRFDYDSPLLPDQTDNAGKVLTTDGKYASWQQSATITYWE